MHFIFSVYLDNKGPVFFTDNEIILPVVFVSVEQGSMEHGCVAELSAIATAQQAPRQLRLVHHGSDNVLGFHQHLVPKLETSALARHGLLKKANY